MKHNDTGLSDTRFQEIFNRAVDLVFNGDEDLTPKDVRAIIEKEFGKDAAKFASMIQKQSRGNA